MSDLSQLSVLVVDPNAAMRQTTARLLQALGPAAVHLAADGVEALATLRGHTVDVVLSEWVMPRMGGPELLDAMRADPALAGIPLLLVTAEVERSHVAQAIRAGVSDLLVKPYTTQRLLHKIKGALGRGVPELPAEARPDAEPVLPLVLIVDDTADNLRLLANLFAGSYRVKVADNGRKALAICQADAPPDLVLLDVMMPGMDGFDVARRMREHPASEHVPVIFVTALDDDGARRQGFDLGAVDFVSKPIEPDLLLVRVRNFIRYVELHKQRQQEFDAMLAGARMREDMERLLREEARAPLSAAAGHVRALARDLRLDEGQRHQVRQIETAALMALKAIDRSTDLLEGR